MDWGLLTSIIGLFLTVCAGILVFGKLIARLETLEARVKEDREHNEKQHTEFYVVKDDSIKMGTKMDAMTDKLDKIEKSLEEVLSRLPRRKGEI